MITIARPHDTLADWDSWRTPLRQFADATGLAVAAYDVECTRQVGPLLSSRSALFLSESSLWRDDGPGSALERRIVAEVLATDQAGAEQSWNGMRIASLPLTRAGQTYGVLVVGWRFADFSSPMACEQIARLAGVSGHALWNEVRLEPPMSAGRMATSMALLHTLVDSIDRQRETIDELNRVSRTRDLFLATVSHEMRTPLAALSMRVELMLRTVRDLPPAVESGLVAMRMHVRQEASMIDDLIDAARTLTGQMSVTRTPVSLGRVLRDAISTVEVMAHEKAVAFSVSPANFGDAITIGADARRLQQVLWNLLLNAVKFTPAGGAVRISIGQGNTHLDINVQDTGQGIASADLPHVFNAFTLQTEGNTTGLGLGLYIARRIVELHGGTLTVASPGQNKGTTFTVRLPLAMADGEIA